MLSRQAQQPTSRTARCEAVWTLDDAVMPGTACHAPTLGLWSAASLDAVLVLAMILGAKFRRHDVGCWHAGPDFTSPGSDQHACRLPFWR